MGHYTSFVQIVHEGKEFWINFDDEATRIVNEEKILSPYSYLLFYKRREFSSSAIINLTFKSFDKNLK
jgi:ubiquitin C-terminal hydrolase